MRNVLAASTLLIGCYPTFTHHTSARVGDGDGSSSLSGDFITPAAGVDKAPAPNGTLRASGKRVELGVRFPSLAIDVKTEIVRSPIVDVALDPRAQLYTTRPGDVVSFFGQSDPDPAVALDAPFLLGLHLGSHMTLLGIAGVGMSRRFADDAKTRGWIELGLATHLHDSGGLSVEALLLQPFYRSEDAQPMLNVGIGWIFGYPRHYRQE